MVKLSRAEVNMSRRNVFKIVTPTNTHNIAAALREYSVLFHDMFQRSVVQSRSKFLVIIVKLLMISRYLSRCFE